MLLPKIKRGVELRRQIAPDFRGVGGGNAVQFRDFLQRRLIVSTSHQPALVAIAPEVALAKVFDPDEAFRRVVKVDLGRAHSMGGEELRDLDVALVLGLLTRIFDEHDGLLARELDAVKFPVGPAFLDRRNFHLRFLEAGKADTRLAQKRVGKDHRLEIVGKTD